MLFRSVAFVGESGAGKSTLAAGLARRGHQIVADDVCFLQLGAYGNVQAWPGVYQIRLWEDARAALGYEGAEVEREIHAYNKYFVPVHPPRNPVESRRLRAVYQLQPARGVTGMTCLHGAAAVEVLLQNVYRLGLAECLGYKPHAFMVCTAAARDVPVFRFSRTLGLDTLGPSIELLESHLRDLP